MVIARKDHTKVECIGFEVEKENHRYWIEIDERKEKKRIKHCA